MDISQVAKKTGLPASTLRYYEEKGLIESVGRSGLKRLFSDNVIERLALISLARSVGFSLQEIRELFATKHQGEINRPLLTRKADELDAQIKRLTKMRDGLRHTAACKAPSHFECPTFLRLLNIAGNKHFQSKSRK